MLMIAVGCIAGALLVVCVMAALSKERQKVAKRLGARVDYSRFDETQMLRNRSERAQDW
jgi:hypothetical protein